MSPDPDPPTASAGPEPQIRIGELSRRTGVRVDTLRAWERRYGLLDPVRTAGGFRLYGPTDEARVRRMRELIEAGHSAAQAAQVIGSAADGSADAATPAPGATGAPGPLGPAAAQAPALVEALVAMDEARAQGILDRCFATLSLESACEVVVLPALREIGERWERGEAGIAEEHFASNLIRARLMALSRGWGGGGERHAVLACPSGERHDLGLIAFGLVLRGRGWKITYLGPDTPVETMAEAAGRLRPDAMVVSALDPDLIGAAAEDLRRLAAEQRVLVAGPDRVTELAEEVGAGKLAVGPVEGARELDRLV